MSDRTQLLRYASDLARLYRSARDDRQRFRAVERTCLELVRALSGEEVAQRVCRAGVDLLGLGSAAVYQERDGRFDLAARDDDRRRFPARSRVSREELDLLDGAPDEFLAPPWSDLTQGEPSVVLPLLGRRRAVGFLVGAGRLEDLERTAGRETLSLLSSQAGVVLENFLLDERRRASPPQEVAGPRSARGGPAELIGRSPPIRAVLALVDRLGRVDSPVLLLGETGTGKSLLARALHEAGPRRSGPFVAINCGAIPESLAESELFGHEAGAFTGAAKRHRGKVEQARGGTLFLDEVGELPPAAQVKLLHLLEEGRFSRVGGEGELPADVRVISATNRDVEAAVEEGSFRRDLLFRLNVFTLTLPPLRERGADVTALARSMAEGVAARYGLPTPELGPRFQQRLLSYPWPGNVRELRNVIEKAVILAGEGPLSEEDLPSARGPLPRPPRAEESSATAHAAAPAAPAPAPRRDSFDPELSFAEQKQRLIERWEVMTIEELLTRSGGNIASAARMARLDKKNLHRKLKRYGIDARRHAPAP